VHPVLSALEHIRLQFLTDGVQGSFPEGKAVRLSVFHVFNVLPKCKFIH